jgi:AcrR family transcriptional regulator
MGRPVGVDGAATRKLILDEAERQFGSVGYATTTTKTIAAACDLTNAAIYHHFGTKISLYEATSAAVHPPMLEAFELALRDVSGFRARLKAILDTAIELNRMRPSLAGFVMGGPVEARRHPELRPVVDHHFSQIEGLVSKLVDDARSAGEISAEASTEDTVAMLLSVLHGFAHLAYRATSVEQHDRAIRTFEQLLDGRLFTSAPQPTASDS